MTLKIRTLIRPAALALCSVLLAQAPQTQEIRIRANGPDHPFPHFWEQMYGSGRAVLALRDDYQARSAQDEKETKTGIRYVRFHAIFHDEVGLYNEDAQGRNRFY